MFFDAEQTLEAIRDTERYRRSGTAASSGKSNILIPLIVGILIGRKTK